MLYWLLFFEIPRIIKGGYDRYTNNTTERESLSEFRNKYKDKRSLKIADVGFEDYYLIQDLLCHRIGIAHYGATTAGEYVNTLNVTDICTGWTEPVAVLNKAQRHVFAGLMDVEQRQPFPHAGIDSDNGSEFINNELYRFCKEKGICFTRSRTYTKNDSCHVEQKNYWSLIRRHIDYNRFEGQAAVTLLNTYYGLLRLHVNFFLPVCKAYRETA